MKRILLSLVLMGFALAVNGQAPIAHLDITADQLLGGSADAQLQELGKKAAADGLEISVTAPAYWKDLVFEQLEAGAGDSKVDLSFRETIIESVIVRLTDRRSASNEASASAAAKDSGPLGPAPEAPKIDDSAVLANAETALREQSRAAMEANAAPVAPDAGDFLKPTMIAIQPLVEPVGTPPEFTVPDSANPDTAGSDPASNEIVASTKSTVAPEPDPAPVESKPEVTTELSTAPTVAGSDIAQDQSIESADQDRSSLERRLNGGRSIDKTLSIGQLRRDDQLFRTGEMIAVVRSSRVGRNNYWLDGEIDLDNHTKIRRIQSGKYQVTGRIEAPKSEEDVQEVADAAAPTDATIDLESDEVLDERSEMEARYNAGHPVDTSLSVAGLRPDDILYVGDSLVMVLRRDRVNLRRYWLEGDVDFERDELEQQGNRKYRVRRQIR